MGNKPYDPVNHQGGMTGALAPYKLTPLEEQYVSLRIRGFDPKRTLQLVDEENHRAPRGKSKLAQDSAELEKKLGHYCAEYVPVEEFSDDEFERYEDHLLQKIAMFPKESAAFAMTALKTMSEKRLKRKTANDGTMVVWFTGRCQEVVRLARIETWLNARPAGGGSQGAGHDDAGHAHLHPGKESGGDNPGQPAILEALSLIRAQEAHVLDTLDQTLAGLREGRHDAAGVLPATTV